MAEQQKAAVGRQAARAILIDDDGRLVLIMHRELAEELGAVASGAARVFLFSSPSDEGVAVQHFFVARLKKLDESARRQAVPRPGRTLRRAWQLGL